MAEVQQDTQVQLQDGTAIIPNGADETAVKQALFDALVSNKEALGEGFDVQSLEWEYEREGWTKKAGVEVWGNSTFGSISEFKKEYKEGLFGGKYTYTYPALAANGDGSYKVRLADTTAEVTLTKAAKLSSSITLNEGCTVSLHSGDWKEVRQEILNEVVAANEYGLTVDNTTIEYYAEAESGSLGDLGKDWAALNGETKQYGLASLTFPAVSDGTYEVRVTFHGSDVYKESTSNIVKVRFASKRDAVITLNPLEEGAVYTAALPYTEEATVDYNILKQKIYQAVVASTTPELTVDDVTIEYYATYQLFNQSNEVSSYEVGKAWVPLEGKEETLGRYPAISEGNQQIKISWGGNEEYYGFEEEVTVNITGRSEAPYTLKATPDAVTLAVGDDMKVDYELLHDAIFNAVVASSDILTADNVTVEYYYNGVTELDSKWLPLEGKAVVGSVGYPAISAGEKKIRISWPGNQQYAPTTIEATITVKDREQVQFNLKDAPYEVGMVFTADQGYNYDATAAAIYNAVVASTTNPTGLTAEDVTVEYNVDKTGITDTFKPLNETDLTGLVKFGTGTWEIRISWAGNQEFKGNSVTVKVTTTDSRAVSTVALKEGVSFTYNMDVNAMKQAIFDNVIDWDNSTLPAKDTLSIDDFVIEYKAKLTDIESGVDLGIGDLIDSDVLTQWVPIEGKVYSIGSTVLGQYPQMGAGENQQIRISYKGNADFRPSEDTEGTVTVNKAKVSVKVNSTNIYADESVPENFITLDPNDKFDLYTIYAGVTSNVTTGIYLDLPDRYTESAFMEVLDPVVKAIYGKSFTQMMNDGVTVGELRQLLGTQELLDLLDKLNIDTGTFGQILTVINKLPGILDSVRISFGTPNRAGLYTVAVVTDSKNYETGVGIGFLLVKMRLSGANLTWNENISGGKLTAEQAKTFNFGATLSYNGDVTVDQSGVHYLYSGFTSKWKIYSSTTTPPTEPGRYVVTVCILGGNYMAAPITRSFQITK